MFLFLYYGYGLDHCIDIMSGQWFGNDNTCFGPPLLSLAKILESEMLITINLEMELFSQ